MTRPPRWQDSAACRDLPISLFFAEWGDPHWDPRPGLAVCKRCPVKTECLDAHGDETHGIFGGTIPEERGHDTNAAAQRRMRARRQATGGKGAVA